jgi:hypothetical protein
MTNNKQQTAVKLYTETEIVSFLKREFADEINAETFMENLTPIEMPSDSLCINCDESKSTHNVCMDCIIKIGRQNIQIPSDEEIWKWWQTQKFQKEQGEQEYTMIYEIDLPKILKAFIENFSKIKGGNK